MTKEIGQEKRDRIIKVISVTSTALGVLMVVYHLISTQYLLQLPFLHQNTHYAFALVLVFLGAILKNRRRWPLYAALLILSLGATIYVQVFYGDLILRQGWPTTVDIYIGCLLLGIGIIATREMFGIILPIIALIFLAYFFFGDLLPGVLHHSHQSFGRIISLLSIGMSGIYGTVLGVSANYIFLFIVFGALLQTTGAIDFFIELGRLISQKLKSGPAITAVVSSSLIGMVSGSAVANVGTTGAFTIPLMKRAGYKPEVAGAIEAAASSGGQIMPPIMGASAFLMAELVGVPYITLIGMAAIAAFFYFLNCGLYVHFKTVRAAIGSASSVEEPKADKRILLTRAPLFIVPLGVLVFLLMQRYSPMFSIFWTIITLVGLSYLQKDTRPSLRKLMEGLATGARGGASIAVASACIGIIMSTLTMTGLGFELSHIIEAVSGGNLIIALIVTAMVSILLGCGMPTLGAYVIVALAVCPALVRMGVDLYAAHFFALYFAVFSAVTPPVAVASLVASGIAGAGYMKTAFHSVKVASAGFLLPFLIVYCPAIILQFTDASTTVAQIVGVAVIILSTSIGLAGQYFTELKRLERTAFFITSAVLFVYAITQSSILFTIGICLFTVLTYWQWRAKRLSDSTRLKVEKAESVQ